jgi:hypothetical protein
MDLELCSDHFFMAREGFNEGPAIWLYGLTNSDTTFLMEENQP